MTTTNNPPISFRLTDEEVELLKQYQEDGEKSLNLTAKRLLLSALGVEVKKPSIQVVNSVDMIQVQELIETAVQEKLEKWTDVNNVDTIKNLIAESLADGEIKEAIASAYTAAMGQFNGLLEELQELKKQFEEFKSSSATVPSHHSPITNSQPPGEDVEAGVRSQEAGGNLTAGGDGENSDRPNQPPNENPKPTATPNAQLTEEQAKIIDLLGIREILYSPISPDLIKAEGIGEKIKNHKQEIEEILKTELDPKPNNTRKMGNILKAAGFNVGGNEKSGYFVKLQK